MKTFPHMRSAKGFAVITAIVLLVVLAAFGAAIAVISSTAQVGSAMDVQSARAYQAARSGVEWAAYQVWNSSQSNRSTAQCPATASFKLPLAPTLSAFTVSVTCTKTQDAAGGPTLFTIQSVACNMPNAAGNCPGASTSIGGLNYIERSVTLTL